MAQTSILLALIPSFFSLLLDSFRKKLAENVMLRAANAILNYCNSIRIHFS